MAGCCILLGIRILCYFSSLHRLGHNVLINLQQEKQTTATKPKTYNKKSLQKFFFFNFLLCNLKKINFQYLYEWTFKGQRLENGLYCIYQAIGNVFLKSVGSA